MTDAAPVIIGAGPAGLTAAYELARHGLLATVLEAHAERVGGLSQTVEYKGFRFDIGGHRFFSKNADIERLWTDILGEDMLTVSRRSRILYQDRYYDYPLRALDACRNLGLMETLRCMLSCLKAHLWPRHPVVSYEDWVTNQFGERLYSLFFKTYTEKVWGMSCRDISADWAAQRIRGLNLFAAVRNAPHHRSLIETFRYPRLGPGLMWESLRRRLQTLGCGVHLDSAVGRIHWQKNGNFTIEVGGTLGQIPTTDIISSMPLRHLIAALDPAPPQAVLDASSRLQYRDFITVVLIVDQPDLFEDNWIYVHDPMVKVARIQNYKNWSADMVPDPRFTCLGLEYFCFQGDGLWNAADVDLVALARQEVGHLHLVDPRRVVDGTVVRMARAYPVYDDEYRDNVTTIRNFLESEIPRLQMVGRNGMHRYNNQDHAMMTGILAARNLMGGQFDLWKVNGDAEYLEEGVVSDSRLVPNLHRVRRGLPLCAETPE